MRMPERFRGDVTVGQLCDVVAAVGDKPEAIDSEVRHIYEWHHSRGVVGIQIALTSAVVAAVATFADDHSRFALPAGILVAVVSVVIGLSVLVRLNRLPDEYAAALRFARELHAHRPPLGRYPTRDSGHAALRSVKMSEFRNGTPEAVSSERGRNDLVARVPRLLAGRTAARTAPKHVCCLMRIWLLLVVD